MLFWLSQATPSTPTAALDGHTCLLLSDTNRWNRFFVCAGYSIHVERVICCRPFQGQRPLCTGREGNLSLLRVGSTILHPVLQESENISISSSYLEWESTRLYISLLPSSSMNLREPEGLQSAPSLISDVGSFCGIRFSQEKGRTSADYQLALMYCGSNNIKPS